MGNEVFFSAALVGLVVLAGFGVFLLLQAVPLVEQQQAQAAFVQNISEGLPFNTGQFYANMRFVSPRITYSFAQVCSENKQAVVLEVFRTLERTTPLRFTTEGTPVFFISCQDLEVPGEEAGHFVAGEGGPTKTINASSFYIIQSANVSLYREETCDTPHVALHEILHALGFDHTADPRSIMFPVTDCKQTLDDAISKELTRLYSFPPYGDLVLRDANVTLAKGYMSFVVTVANQGLGDITNVTLVVEGDNKREFSIGEIGIGKRKIFSVDNIRVSEISSVTFTVFTAEPELSLRNNRAVLATREPLNSGSNLE